jgi:hypothetical protein
MRPRAALAAVPRQRNVGRYRAETWFVEGVSARVLAQPLEIAARFSLRNKTPLHYAWLIVTVGGSLRPQALPTVTVRHRSPADPVFCAPGGCVTHAV